MTAYNWATRVTELQALFALGSPPTGEDAAVAHALIAKLQQLGGVYAANYTVGLDAQRTAIDAANASAVTAWSTLAATYFAQLDRLARYAESLQIAAQVGTPNLYSCDGHVLAPNTPIAWSATETPIVDASHMFRNSTPADVVLITAKDGGPLGNAITVAIANSTDPLLFNVTVTLESYVETFIDQSPGVAAFSGSLLLASLQWIHPPVRPANISATHLASGSGGTTAAINARAVAAQSFPSVNETLRAQLQEYIDDANTQHAQRPVLSYPLPLGPMTDTVSSGGIQFGIYNGLIELETALRALGTEADTFFFYWTSLVP